MSDCETLTGQLCWATVTQLHCLLIPTLASRACTSPAGYIKARTTEYGEARGQASLIQGFGG